MKNILSLLLCFVVLFHSVFLVGAEQISDNGSASSRFAELINNLDSINANDVLVWIDDIDYNIVAEATYMKTGIKKDEITDDLGIDVIQNYSVVLKNVLERKCI